jgi:hypothetical protein
MWAALLESRGPFYALKACSRRSCDRGKTRVGFRSGIDADSQKPGFFLTRAG